MLNRIIYIVAGVILFFLPGSCNKSGNEVFVVSSKDDIKQFIKKENEKYGQEKKIKDINFKLNYISGDQMALRDVQDLEAISQPQFDSIVKNYDSLLVFNLEISIDNFNDELLKYKLDGNIDASYNKRIDYYMFGMQKDINIVLAGKDTVPCILYHFERNYGVSPKNNFMLGFRASSLKDAVLVYENKFLDAGIIKFAINEEEIINHTHIKID
ncbi:MAG TPA: hypothetical protein VGF30_16540 [Bacteroidia bacterium]